MWGIRGVLDWVARFRRDLRLRSFFKKNARKYPYPQPESGITIIGALSGGAWSLSKVLRDFAHSLRDAGIPFQTYDIGNGKDPSEDYADIMTPRSEFRIRRYSHVVEMVSSPLPDGIVDHRSRIVFWEFQEGVGEAFHPLIERDDGIIAMSDFNFEYFKREFGSRIHVSKILYPLQMNISTVPSKRDCRRKFNLGENDFLVFYNFAYTSGWWRKNPIGVVRVFARALRKVPEARLIFKTSARKAFANREAELMDAIRNEGVSDKVVLFNDWMPQCDLYALTNACDVCLSLHRAEGFGLGVAEAMLLSKPVIVTDYSATTEFCKADNSMLVPCERVAIPPGQKDAVWYRAVQTWAEPDLDAAASALAQLHSQPELRERLGRAARASLMHRYSISQFRESVLDFLSS